MHIIKAQQKNLFFGKIFKPFIDTCTSYPPLFPFVKIKTSQLNKVIQHIQKHTHVHTLKKIFLKQVLPSKKWGTYNWFCQNFLGESVTETSVTLLFGDTPGDLTE